MGSDPVPAHSTPFQQRSCKISAGRGSGSAVSDDRVSSPLAGEWGISVDKAAYSVGTGRPLLPGCQQITA